MHSHRQAASIASIGKSSTTTQHNPSKSLSISNLESQAPYMQLNVKSMLLHGVTGTEVVRNWMASIGCEEYVKNFIENGYDMPLLSRMTPQDLTAIGCKSPDLRRKLLSEIKKLNLKDDIPKTRPHSFEQWLELLKLTEYHDRLCQEGYNTIDKVCELTWEDLEEIGIYKLGHQKKLLIGIENVKKFDKLQEERRHDFSIYDVHPNHRVSLSSGSGTENRYGTLGRGATRSGFFQTKPGANLDHRGLPITPALKQVNSSLAKLDISHHQLGNNFEVTHRNSVISTNSNNNGNINSSPGLHNGTLSRNQPNNLENCLTPSETTFTMKRNPPPLPPIRSNSLKIGGPNQLNDNNLDQHRRESIYGNSYGVLSNGDTGTYLQTNNNANGSFIRSDSTTTPTSYQTSNQATAVSMLYKPRVPVREAPLPPLPANPPRISERIEEETLPRHDFADMRSTMITNQPFLGHQLASADEFPPPPPSQ